MPEIVLKFYREVNMNDSKNFKDLSTPNMVPNKVKLEGSLLFLLGLPYGQKNCEIQSLIHLAEFYECWQYSVLCKMAKIWLWLQKNGYLVRSPFVEFHVSYQMTFNESTLYSEQLPSFQIPNQVQNVFTHGEFPPLP